jgi:transglutaminase-like putative cysteine protease
MGSETRTRLSLWFLLAAGVMGFGQLVAEADYRGPAILAILLASGVAILIRRIGLGTILTSVASLGGLAWYLALVFEPRSTWWTLPTPTALVGLGRQVREAYGFSLVDYAPVPLRPGYAIMIVTAAWLATTIGELATFRWRRPLFAVILPLTMSAFAMVVGTGEGAGVSVILLLAALLTFWTIESTHHLRSWGRWLGPEEGVSGPNGMLARRIGASCLAATFMAPLFLPAIGEGLVSWRSGLGDGTGVGSGSGGARIDPWVSISPRLIEQADIELFEVRAEEAAYWRLVSLEFFDGVDWHEGTNSMAPALDGVIPGPDTSKETRSTLIQEVTITGLRGQSLPAAQSPSRVVALAEGEAQPAEGIQYDPLSGSVAVSSLQAGDVYQVRSEVPDLSFEALTKAEPAGTALLPEGYFQRPPGLSLEVEALTQRWTRDAESPFEKLVAIQDRLRRFDYSLDVGQPESEDHLRDFLLNTRTGYCQQFATSFAVMARILGYPSRVSVGFLPGSQDLRDSAFRVSGTDAHAWPEVFLQGFGWIAFEPTPREAYTTPGYTAPTPERLGPITGSDATNRLRGNDSGNRGGLERSEGLGPDGRPIMEQPRDAQSGLGTSGSEWQRSFYASMRLMLLVLGSLLLLTPFLKQWLIRRRSRRTDSPGGIAEAAFVEFQLHAAELASARRPGESARSYAARLAGEDRIDADAVAELIRSYELAAYSPSEPSAESAAAARDSVPDLRRSLWGSASWWKRATYLFSPSGLLPTARRARRSLKTRPAL